MRILRFLVLTAGAALLSGCSTLAFWHDSDPSAAKPAGQEDEAPVAVKPKSSALSDEQELKVAKLWARVDELEEEQYRQKERIRVLEKGLTLGLVPEELKHPEKTKAAQTAPKAAKNGKKPAKPKTPVAAEGTSESDGADDHAAADGAGAEKLPAGDKPSTEGAAAAAATAGLAKADAEKYQTMLADAHDHYRAGRYGRAIVEYSDIGKQFGDQVGGGMHLYWLAKCWSNLKEYNTARQQLIDFLKDHGTSPWAPRAKLELARVEWQLGMQETALQRFREIIQEHPYEDAAEMAKMELENLDKKL